MKHLVMLLKPTEHAINMIINILKITLVASFLLVEGLGQHGIFNFAILFLYLYTFIENIVTLPHSHEIFWEGGLLSIPAIATLIVLLQCKQYKDRYLLLFCCIALLVAIIFMTGFLNFDGYKRITSWFIFPVSIFIISSIGLIILNFKKPPIKKE